MRSVRVGWRVRLCLVPKEVSGPSMDYSSPDARLERAVQYVSDYWIPVDSSLLERIQKQIKNDAYQGELTNLLQDVKSDPALFSHCLRRLAVLYRQGNPEAQIDLSPAELLQSAGYESLAKVLYSDSEQVSTHTLNQATDKQVARLNEVLISATTAEALGAAYQIDPEEAFSAAMLRQLGFTLIAWNYPGLYEEALAELSESEGLERVIARKLGFSPMMLAMRVLRSWGISAESCSRIGLVDEEDLEEVEIRDALADIIVTVCRVGEALARAQSPDTYPSARKDWSSARSCIEEKLGSDGMGFLRERFDQIVEHYLTFMPHIFAPGLVFDPEIYNDERRSDEVIEQNPMITRCQPEVQTELRKLYEVLKSADDIHKVLRELVRETIPSCGFTGGCIYTADPGMMMLVPQLEVGEVSIHDFEPIDYSVVKSNANMISVAYQSPEPVVGYRVNASGEPITTISGVYGKSQRVGVISLEMPQSQSTEDEKQQVESFRAITRALNDCLGL